jgi:hypothetical protein
MRQIRLSKGLYTLVDDEDYAWLTQWTWYASHESRGTKWYAIRREGRVKIRMHRAIVERRGLIIPDGHVVDHVNHNSLDNRFSSNLEIVSQTENMRRSPGWKKKGMKCG